MRKVFILFVAIITTFSLTLSLAAPAFAKHKAKSAKGPSLSASRAKNKLSVSANFSNLANVKSVSYQLTYDSSKGQQGAAGTIKVGKSKNLSRKLLLGTCSGKVCTYHNDVKNLKLSADFTLKSGGVVSYEKSL